MLRPLAFCSFSSFYPLLVLISPSPLLLIFLFLIVASFLIMRFLFNSHSRRSFFLSYHLLTFILLPCCLSFVDLFHLPDFCLFLSSVCRSFLFLLSFPSYRSYSLSLLPLVSVSCLFCPLCSVFFYLLLSCSYCIMFFFLFSCLSLLIVSCLAISFNFCFFRFSFFPFLVLVFS